jgi:hypothetical protein
MDEAKDVCQAKKGRGGTPTLKADSSTVHWGEHS